MNYLLDTNHWSYLQRRDPAVIARVQRLPGDARLLMPVIAQAELLAGIALVRDARRQQELRRLYESTIADWASGIVSITPDVAEQYAEVVARLRADGRTVSANDLWIASIAMVNGLILATNDAAFQCIDGLELEDWTRDESNNLS